jgi:hypothetical protein
MPNWLNPLFCMDSVFFLCLHSSIFHFWLFAWQLHLHLWYNLVSHSGEWCLLASSHLMNSPLLWLLWTNYLFSTQLLQNAWSGATSLLWFGAILRGI